MGLLLSILFFLLFIAVFFIIAVFGVLRSIFGFGKRNRQHSTGSGSEKKSQTENEYDNRNKIFGSNEGEYVDFEEIKKNDTDVK